jgi:hypothetical protein
MFRLQRQLLQEIKMNRTFALRSGILAAGLLAASGFASAADSAPEHAAGASHGHHQRFDPVARTRHNLDSLAKKLDLKEEQQAAWQAYADGALSRAEERTAKMQDHRAHKGEARAETDTATRLDRLSQAMRDRADRLQKIAADTRAFEGVLSSEQKTIFDLYWKSKFHPGMMHHRPS